LLQSQNDTVSMNGW